MLHPLTLFGLLCVGIIILSSSLASSADPSYAVNAVVPAPIITTAATITSPTDGQVFTTSPITVTGNCVNNSYVTLMRDGYSSGSAICQIDGTYSIETDLSPGSNSLVAQIYNVTNQAGPPSSAINVTYTPPATTIPPSGSASSSGSNTEVVTPVANSPKPSVSSLYNHSGIGTFQISSSFQYRTFTTQNSYLWNLTISGGTQPYVVEVNWGDGSTSNYYIKDPSTFKISHDFRKSGTYNILVSGIDSAGEEAVTQLSIKIVNNEPAVFGTTGVGGGLSKAANGLGFFKSNHHLLSIVGSTYGIILLMTFSFWLGERRELKIMLSRQPIKKTRRRV
jgi:hypothetical protein